MTLRSRPGRWPVVLVTGCGGPAAVGFTRSLARTGRYRTVGTDCSAFAIPFSETDTTRLVPRATDPGYVEAIVEIIEDEGVTLVHPQPDAEVLALSRSRDQIPTRLFLPRQDTVELCQDKYASYEAWRAAGLTVPDTSLLERPADVGKAFANLGGVCWLRARRGAGGRGSLLAHDVAVATSWVDMNRGWGEFTASEVLPGGLLTWQSLWRDGKLVVAQSRERLSWSMGSATMSGVSGMTGAARTVRRGDLDSIAEAAVRAVDPRPDGLFGVDLKENADGVPCPTEINVGRFFTTIQFFTELGCNIPELYVSVALGESPPPVADRYNPLPTDWYWLRSADATPRLLHADDLAHLFDGDPDPGRHLHADRTVTYGLVPRD